MGKVNYFEWDGNRLCVCNMGGLRELEHGLMHNTLHSVIETTNQIQSQSIG